MTKAIGQKKRFIIIGAAIAALAALGLLLWLLIPSPISPLFPTGGLRYEKRATSVCITGYEGDATVIDVPAEIGGLPVTEIAASAFENDKDLTQITFPDTLIKIGARAFKNCSALESITIPKNVTSLGEEAFAYCTDVTKIDFLAACIPNPDDYKSIRAFLETGTRGVGITLTVGEDVSRIPMGLASSSHVKEIVFAPNSVCTDIDEQAFSFCSELTSVVIPASVRELNGSAFMGCQKLTSIAVNVLNTTYYSVGNCVISRETKTLVLGCNGSIIPQDQGISKIANEAFSFCKELTEVTVPSTVTVIEPHAFYACTKLAVVTLPAGLRTIGVYAFGQCHELISIKIPATVTEIELCAFDSCAKLRSAQFENPDGWTVRKGDGDPEIPLSASSLLELPTAASFLRKDYDAYYWKRSE